MRIGYARVSTELQHSENQAIRLKDAGCEVVYADQGASGRKASRPEWDALIASLRAGDTLVCTKLDRIGRSVTNLVAVATHLRETEVDLVCLDQAIDTSTAQGKLFFHIISAFAEFESDIIRERTLDGLAAARERHGGTLPQHGNSVMKPAKLAAAQSLLSAGMRPSEVAQTLSVGRATIYRHLGAGTLTRAGG